MNSKKVRYEECGSYWIDKVINLHYNEMYEAVREAWAEINDLNFFEEVYDEDEDDTYDEDLTDEVDDLFRESDTYRMFIQAFKDAGDVVSSTL